MTKLLDRPGQAELLALCDEIRRHGMGEPTTRIAEAIWAEHGVRSPPGRLVDRADYFNGTNMNLWLEDLPPLSERAGVSLDRIHERKPDDVPTAANIELHKFQHRAPRRGKVPMPPGMCEAILAYIAEHLALGERVMVAAKAHRHPLVRLPKELRRWKRLHELLNGPLAY